MNTAVLSTASLTLLAVVSVASSAAAAAPALGVDQPIDFNRQIRPILSNTCFRCHGPDKDDRQAGLRLDTREGATAEHDSGVTIVPGKPEESVLIQRILSNDPDERMPPKKAGSKLTPEQISLIRQWIQQGAPYARHWSYVKPQPAPVPVVRKSDWPKNNIDRFILARLEQDGLQPAPEADRPTLIRRLSLDLTGLPPTIDEVEQFVKDPSPDAYERLVDRLLARPAYGEHWARMWLDLAGYADSAGYADDPPRTIWAYRDYVIRSINANQPFDQFTIEQIAGDLLPKATEEQQIATAFHRNTLTNNEGGTDDEEFRNVAIVDRVNTTMAVWMGTTMACAQCHDHKYDPISQEDYFRFFAIFNSTQDSDKKDENPLLKVANTSVPVMRQLPKPRTTNIQRRGNFLDKGKEVSPGVPAALYPLPTGTTVDRLALARWLVDRDNPLTARVIANRYWEAIFGVGIVRTSEEFGSQGELPVNQELLDYLAIDLVEHHWDIKRLLKTLVTAAAYRQSSRVTAALLEADPENRLLARGPRFRLSAEMVRDQALAAGGLLSPKMFGPPVNPPQPNLGLSAAFGGTTDWKTSTGEDRYRRAIYTSWRRSNPYPSMAAFDAPNREVCTMRRDRTNTPLQSLVTLNDPVYLEAAQALARRTVKAAASSPDRATYMFRVCLARDPSASERQRLVALFDQARARYLADPSSAQNVSTKPLGAVPKETVPKETDMASLAAWTLVGNVMLNLDEILMKR